MALIVSVASCAPPQPEADQSTTETDSDREERVTGIGGIFFKSDDPGRTLAWYREHLGIESADWGGFAFRWGDHQRPNQTGYTVWGAFPETTSYFAPSEQPFMVNFRVAG
jgi:hypothetical protein